MPSNFERLVFEIIATDRDASAAFARFRRQVDDTSGSVDKSSRALDKHADALDKNRSHSVSAIGALIGVGTAFGPIAGGAAAAGAGFVAFAALAVPSVLKVSTALSSTGGGLAAQWVTLDNRQRNAALGVQALDDRYHSLAQAMEPRVFQVFNQTLGFTNSLLGPVAKLADSAGRGLSYFVAQFSAHSGIQQFITFLSGQAGPALALLSSDVTHIAHAVFQLIQATGGAGLLELRALAGVFTALDDAITFLSQHAPGLTSVALMVGGLAVALAKIGALGSVLKLTGLASIATEMTGFAAATAGATVAEKGLLATTTVLDAITPFGWAVLGAAALGGLVFWLSRFKTTAQTTISSLESLNRAQGYNTFGYYAAAVAIRSASAEQEKFRVSTYNVHTGIVSGSVAINDLSGATGKYTAESAKLVSEGDSQLRFLETLQAKYHLNESGAKSLAIHAGVLASQVNKGGQSMKDATARAEAYANSNLRAQSPVSQLAQDIEDYSNKTLTAKDRTKALSDALNQFFNPLVTADQAVVTMKNDQVALAASLKASGDKTGLLTQKQRDARGAFETYITDVATAAQKAFDASHKTSDYTRVINDALPYLEKAAGHNRTLRAEIQRLIDTERRMHTESVALSIKAKGTWDVVGTGAFAGKPTGFAAGGRVTGGVPGRDSVPIMAMPGEVVVPTPMVAAGAVDHLRGRLPGFAAGGVVGSYDRSGLTAPDGLNTWLKHENRATAQAIIHAEILAMHKAAITGSGSSIVNYAMKFLGTPYVWGGTTPSGWDCCLVSGVRIYGPRGAIPIEDITAGDLVYSYEDGRRVAAKVTRQWKSEHQPVFAVRTRNRTVTASANHPFLRLVQVERARSVKDRKRQASRYEAEWVRLDQLRRGDLLVQPRSLATEPAGEPVLAAGTTVDADVAWLLGAITGDGTVTAKGLNLALYGERRDRATDIIASRWGSTVGHSAKHGLFVSSARLRDELTLAGLRRPGPDKRLPAEVWEWPADLQRAFLNGYCDADGHRPARIDQHGQRTYHSASRELIEDTRALHITLGDAVSNVHVTRRTAPIVIKGKTVRNARDQHAFTVWSGKRQGTWAAEFNQGIAAWAAANPDFTATRLLAVTPAGEADTWDLEIDGTHSFIADGLVVHNSGFTSWDYHHFGIPAPRTSQQQQLWARPSGDVPGALVFFYGTGGTASHVGLSMGHGRMINASSPATGTVIRSTAGNSGFGIPPGGFGRGGAAIGSSGGGGTAIELGRSMAEGRYFWGGPQWQALDSLWMQESGWNRFARNPFSGAYGIPQALPPGKMGAAANPPTSSAAAQIAWGLGYIRSAYGDPVSAMAHERQVGWYDHGGYLPQGLSLALNTTGRPEPVGAAAGNSVVINGPIHIHMPHGADGSDIVKALQKFNRQNGPARINVRSYP